MIIQTKFHGELTVQARDLWHFTRPILGFEEESCFVLLPFSKDNLFFILQSVQTPSLAFYVVSPWKIQPDYGFELSEEFIGALGFESEEDVQVYNIVSVAKDFSQSTVNLLAPIVLNCKTNQAGQCVLTDDCYTTRHPLIKGV